MIGLNQQGTQILRISLAVQVRETLQTRRLGGHLFAQHTHHFIAA
jgi:hypothetical protein